MTLTRASEVTITIGEVKIRVGDLAGFENGEVVMKNGMRLKTELFAQKALQKTIERVLEEKKPNETTHVRL